MLRSDFVIPNLSCPRKPAETHQSAALISMDRKVPPPASIQLEEQHMGADYNRKFAF